MNSTTAKAVLAKVIEDRRRSQKTKSSARPVKRSPRADDNDSADDLARSRSAIVAQTARDVAYGFDLLAMNSQLSKWLPELPTARDVRSQNVFGVSTLTPAQARARLRSAK